MQARTIGIVVAALLQAATAFSQAQQTVTNAAAGVIKGRILDESGEPLPAVRVAVGKFSARAGGRFISIGRPTYADPQGYYEIRDVPPGEWVVNAQGGAMRGGMRVSVGTPEYAPTYFPGVVEPESAQAIVVAAGHTLDNVSFFLRRAALHTLRVPIDLAGVDPAGVEIVLMSANGLNTHTLTSVAIGDDGQFAIGRLKPGNYLLWVRGKASDGVQAGAREVSIGADTIELPLSLNAAAGIIGRIIGDSGERDVPTGLRVSAPLILEQDRPASFPVDSADVSTDGRFVLQGLFGRRGLRIDGLPHPWTLRRVIVGGQELPPTAVIDLRDGQTLDATFVVGRNN